MVGQESRDDIIARLDRELTALKQVRTAEEQEEGERLHRLHNAPWVHGAYTHLGPEVLNPPDQYREFPRMLYGLDYPDAVKARAEADEIPAFGMDDAERKKAILLADARIKRATVIVKSEQELRAIGANWFQSPDDVVTELKRRQTAKEHGQAHRDYEDRNLTGRARREAQAFDDAAEDFTPEIPETPRRRPTSRLRATARGLVPHGKK